MKFLEKTKSEEIPIYPQVKWGKQENYGLAGILFVLVERDPNIQANLFPLNDNNSGKRTAQCKKLAKTLFTNIPEINIHLGNPDGLTHYTTSVLMRLRRWTDTFLSVLFTIPQYSNWPDREKIKSLCPSFARLAPLLWGFLKTRKKFFKPDMAIAMKRANLDFCSAITVYDPQRAAAQVAAQDAVLRQLQDPYGRNHDFAITDAIPSLNMGGKRGGCSSQQDQEDVVDEGHLRKKQRRHGRFEELNPQIPEKVRHSNNKPELPKAYLCLHSDRNTPTYAIPRRMNHNFVASADSKEEFHPWNSPPQITKPSASPPLPKISHVSSSKLFVARLEEAARLENQALDCAPPPASPPHQDEHEPARKLSRTATRTQVHTNDDALGSTYSPRFFKMEEGEDVNEARSWLELDKARLSRWKQIAENNSHSRSDLDTVIKDEKRGK